MPESIKTLIDQLASPTTVIVLSTVLLFALLRFRNIFASVPFGVVSLVSFIVFYVLSMADEDFRLIVTKGDNVPITIMLLLLGISTWVAFREMKRTDDAMDAGETPRCVVEGGQKVFVWPDLVYIELIAAVLVGAFLTAWSVGIDAPLEQPASPTNSPNPAKAPWYFLGLQEMLVYFDPWLAGVVFPTFILVGLMAIPYIDTNPKGNGYYTFNERPFAIGFFLFGFIILWVVLIIMGTFLRGPNWNFFGPYEYWDAHASVPLVNVNLSEFFWLRWLEKPLPGSILLREAPGILVTLGYFVAGPAIMQFTLFKKYAEKMGPARFAIFAILFLCMVSLLIKMVLRWAFNLKYIIAIPEFFLNV